MKRGKKSKRIKRTKTQKRKAIRKNRIKIPQIPQTARQYFALSRQFQESWDSVAHAISRMRSDGVPLPKAAREFDVAPDHSQEARPFRPHKAKERAIRCQEER